MRSPGPAEQDEGHAGHACGRDGERAAGPEDRPDQEEGERKADRDLPGRAPSLLGPDAPWLFAAVFTAVGGLVALFGEFTGVFGTRSTDGEKVGRPVLHDVAFDATRGVLSFGLRNQDRCPVLAVAVTGRVGPVGAGLSFGAPVVEQVDGGG